MGCDHPQSSRATAVTEYFTGLAQDYDAYRPSYPRQAIHAIVDGLPPPVRAVDIGCGTGISTRLLAERCASVIGIDPNRDMFQIARASASLANVSYAQGTAEKTGLREESMDLVVCAQAFHWFDADAALREFARVLRPGGRVALMWNAKTEANAFSAAFCEIARRAQADARTRGLIAVDDRDFDLANVPLFTNVRRLSFANDQSLDLKGVLGRARSASYFPREGPLRDELEAELTSLFQQHAEHGRVILTHLTSVTLADNRHDVIDDNHSRAATRHSRAGGNPEAWDAASGFPPARE